MAAETALAPITFDGPSPLKGRFIGPKARKAERPPGRVAPQGPGPWRKAKRADARAGA